jgi:hypothetical protein
MCEKAMGGLPDLDWRGQGGPKYFESYELIGYFTNTLQIQFSAAVILRECSNILWS